jgi:hypothetical protein
MERNLHFFEWEAYMKTNLLFITVVFAGLAGFASAQNYQPGEGAYGQPGVIPNVTAGQLTQWMQGSIGSSVATADQWCYAMGQLVTGGYTCPAPENLGFSGPERNATVDAQTFLNDLQAYYSGANTAPYTAPYVADVGPPAEASPGVVACRRAVHDRLRDEGYHDVTIPSIHAEDRPGGADRVYGFAEAQGPSGGSRFDFSCAVNLERGEVHSLDVNRR